MEVPNSIIVVIAVTLIPGAIAGLVVGGIPRLVSLGISTLITPALTVLSLVSAGNDLGHGSGEGPEAWGFFSMMIGTLIGVCVGYVEPLLIYCIRDKRGFTKIFLFGGD